MSSVRAKRVVLRLRNQVCPLLSISNTRERYHLDAEKGLVDAIEPHLYLFSQSCDLAVAELHPNRVPHARHSVTLLQAVFAARTRPRRGAIPVQTINSLPKHDTYAICRACLALMLLLSWTKKWNHGVMIVGSRAYLVSNATDEAASLAQSASWLPSSFVARIEDGEITMEEADSASFEDANFDESFALYRLQVGCGLLEVAMPFC
jgi:hypothetical protein